MKLQYGQKTEKRLNLCPESVYHKKYVKLQITNKTGKLKVQIKASFCKIVVTVNIWSTVVLKDVAVMKSNMF